LTGSADDDEVVRPARHPISGRGHRVIEGRQENVRLKRAGYPPCGTPVLVGSHPPSAITPASRKSQISRSTRPSLI